MNIVHPMQELAVASALALTHMARLGAAEPPDACVAPTAISGTRHTRTRTGKLQRFALRQQEQERTQKKAA